MYFFSGYRIIGWQFFFFQCSTLHCFRWENCRYSFVSLYIWCVLKKLTALKIFFFITDFIQFNDVPWYSFFLVSSACVHWSIWICGFIDFYQILNSCSRYQLLNIFLFSLPLPQTPNMYIRPLEAVLLLAVFPPLNA